MKYIHIHIEDIDEIVSKQLSVCVNSLFILPTTNCSMNEVFFI